MPVSRGQYWAIKEQLTPQEKKMINYYELQWALQHRVPTISEVAKQLEIPQTSVNYYFNRKPVVAALTKRGIPFRQHTQSELTSEQVATAIVMMNFADVRSNPEKLDQLGINPEQYQAWLQDPQFKNLIDSIAGQNLINIKPHAITELTKKINQGDLGAIKYYLDTTGAIANNDAPQSEQLIVMLIEIIQKHVKDPEVILAIAQDIKLASANRTLEAVMPPAQIVDSVSVDSTVDVELEHAKKMIGF